MDGSEEGTHDACEEEDEEARRQEDDEEEGRQEEDAALGPKIDALIEEWEALEAELVSLE